jgi:hypothetical protein
MDRRAGIEPGDLRDARQQQPRGAELCDRQELVGIRGQPETQPAPGILGSDSLADQPAQRTDGGGDGNREFLNLRCPGIVPTAPVGGDRDSRWPVGSDRRARKVRFGIDIVACRCHGGS